MTEEKNNLTFSSSGSAPGGTYADVAINGSGKILGDVDCRNMDVNGSGKALGSVQAARVMVSGSARFEKNICARLMTINGSSSIHGKVKADLLQINGHARIDEGVQGEQVKVSGVLILHGDLVAEEITSEGQLRIDGLCTAERIDMTLGGMHSQIKEIGCATVVIRKRPFASLVGQLLFGARRQRITVDTIEGDEIYIESTRAKAVRGKRVTIGPDCEIDEVTYTDTYACDDRAHVGSATKK
ncbi:MAG: polymer-forming cytoskeletal protein [Sporolactobacillus sp.]